MKQLKTNNFLADDLEIEERHIKCDQAIKRVLATMSILARTVKGTVTEVKNMSIAEIESAIDHESIEMILSILVDTLNSYKEDSYAAIGRAA